MRVAHQVLYIFGFSLSVQAEGASSGIWRRLIARAPQGPVRPIQPGRPLPGKGPPGQRLSTPPIPITSVITSILSIPVTSVVTSTVTDQVTVISSRTEISSPTSSPPQTSPSVSSVSSNYSSQTFSQPAPSTSVQITSTLSSYYRSTTPVIPSMSENLKYPMETPSPSSSSASAPHQTLVIVLSTILGSIAIILVVLVLFLICRIRKRKHFKRGVSPINDEEIESWRNKERKQPLASPPRGIINTISNGRISPDWTWTSSGNVQSPPRAHTRGPSLLAKAPNARVGLTTEVVPGDAPFIPIVKRQSSRLSKSQPSHIRTKSMRSSTSARSMRSMNGGSVGVIDFLSEEGVPRWHNSEDRRVESHAFSGIGTSSPATSVYVGSNEAGGLSPRPQSRQWEKSPQSSGAPGWPISWN